MGFDYCRRGGELENTSVSRAKCFIHPPKEKKKKKRAQRNLIPLNFRQMEERHVTQN